MPGKWGYIGGGAALLFAGIVASRSDLLSRPAGEATSTAGDGHGAGTDAHAGAPAPAPVAAAPAPDGGDLARLTAELAAREAENAELRTTLAVRDAVIESLEADLAERDDHARRPGGPPRRQRRRDRRPPPRARGARAAQSLDAKRAVFEAGPAEPSAARVEAVRAAAPDLEAIFDAAKAPAGLPALPSAALRPDPSPSISTSPAPRLTPGGQIHAAAAAVRSADLTLARVRLVGHTDRVGGPAANRRLAARARRRRRRLPRRRRRARAS